MSVFLLFVWWQAMPGDNVKTSHLIGVYDSMHGRERAADFYERHLVAKAEVFCVQRMVEK